MRTSDTSFRPGVKGFMPSIMQFSYPILDSDVDTVAATMCL